jgi:hypothetical protein
MSMEMAQSASKNGGNAVPVPGTCFVKHGTLKNLTFTYPFHSQATHTHTTNCSSDSFTNIFKEFSSFYPRNSAQYESCSYVLQRHYTYKPRGRRGCKHPYHRVQPMLRHLLTCIPPLGRQRRCYPRFRYGPRPPIS